MSRRVRKVPAPTPRWTRAAAQPVVIVSGLPRSGTSMAMKMLHAGGMEVLTDGVRRADEDNPEGYFELERTKELAEAGDLRWLHGARGKAVKVISYLLPYLPDDLDYRVVFMIRDLEEILASQARMLERLGEPPGASPLEMRQGYVDHLVKIRTILSLRACFAILEIGYLQAIQEPQRVAERLREFVDLPLDADRMARAVNPSLYRNRGDAESSTGSSGQ
jgi:hypothetical protein